MATASSFTWKEDCKNLLDILNREEDSEHFREPVNLLLYTNYFKYVDHPMDLQTVGLNLKANNYATLSEFAKDVRLILENSKKFNQTEKRKIYGQTNRLSDLFEDHIRIILATGTYEAQSKAAGCKSQMFLLIFCQLIILLFCRQIR